MQLINDFQTSVRKAFDEIDPDWEKYNGVVICGTHSPEKTEEAIEVIRLCRESGIPFLGICAGFQLAAIEWARHVLGVTDATSEEFGTGTFVVKKMPGFRVGIKMSQGGFENYWHQYTVDISYLAGLTIFLSEGFADMIKVADKPFFAVQFHPEYNSTPDKPHPLLKNFLKSCKEHTHV